MIVKIQSWKTTDGKLFDNVDAAMAHEKIIQFKKFLSTNIFTETQFYKTDVEFLGNRFEEFFDGIHSINESVEYDVMKQEKKS